MYIVQKKKSLKVGFYVPKTFYISSVLEILAWFSEKLCYSVYLLRALEQRGKTRASKLRLVLVLLLIG